MKYRVINVEYMKNQGVWELNDAHTTSYVIEVEVFTIKHIIKALKEIGLIGSHYHPYQFVLDNEEGDPLIRYKTTDKPLYELRPE